MYEISVAVQQQFETGVVSFAFLCCVKSAAIGWIVSGASAARASVFFSPTWRDSYDGYNKARGVRHAFATLDHWLVRLINGLG